MTEATGFIAGGRGSVDCGTTAIGIYNAGTGLEGGPFQVASTSSKPVGRREWNNDKHEHCLYGNLR
jgi:hypothetical protein